MAERRLNSIIVYGHAGYGKTSSVAMSVPNALWVVTRTRNLDGYRDFLMQEPEKATEMGLSPVNSVIEVPHKTIDPNTGALLAVDTKAFLDSVLQSYCRKVVSGEADFDGIVFDEFSVFANRVYNEMKERTSDGFKVIAQFKQWIADILEIGPITDRPMVLICHAKDPAYYDKGPKTGQVKYKGGPAMPIGTVIAEVCAMPDAVLQMDVTQPDITNQDEVKRVFKTQAHPLWERKCRLWGVDPVIDADLRSLLNQAGWQFAQ